MRLPLLLPAAALLAGCASEPQPWKVERGREETYEQASHACEILTDEPDGFDRCMKRRGFRRRNVLDRVFIPDQ